MSARAALAIAAALVLLAACGSGGGAAAPPPPTGPAASSSPAAAVEGEVVVFAAASLTAAFTELGTQFEAQNPSSTVTFNFGPSSGLATSITEGAPADVFASASTKTMQTVVDAGAAVAPTTFATNSMEIAVPSDNPSGIRAIADLAKADVKVALCQEQVPCGATALEVLENAGVEVTPVTLEVDVKATLAKVRSGDADAAIVYVTDVRDPEAGVQGVPIPADVNASTDYPIAPLAGAPNAAGARAFVDLVLSPDGRAVLGEVGFGAG